MPSPWVHYGAGLAISSLAGSEGKSVFKVAIFAILADLDFLTGFLLDGIVSLVKPNHETYVLLATFLGHREFLHTLLFAGVVAALVWVATRKSRLTALAAALLVSHPLIDSLSTWGVRILFPFSGSYLTLNILFFYDVALNGVTAFLAGLFVIRQLAPSGKLPRFKKRLPSMVKWSLALLAAYVLLIATGKGYGVHSRKEKGSPGYLQVVPHSFYHYAYCRDLGSHWQVTDFAIASPRDRLVNVEKVQVTAGSAERLAAMDLSVEQVLERCRNLLAGDRDSFVTYGAFRIDVQKQIQVRVFDARREAARIMIPDSDGFSMGYIFEFPGRLETFAAYIFGPGFERMAVPRQKFE